MSGITALRRLRNILVGLGLFAAVVAGVLLLVTGTGPGSRWLAAQVMTRVQKDLPFKLSVGAIRRHGLSRWTIGPVEGREPSSDRLFLRADRVTFDLRYRPLLSGNISLARARVDSLFLAAWLDSADALHPQLTQREADSLAAGAPDSGKPFPLSIDELSIGGLLLGMDAPHKGLYTRYRASDVGGGGSGADWSGRLDGRLIQRSPYTADSLAGGLRIVLDITREAVHVDTLRWNVPGFGISARGTWSFQDAAARLAASGYAALDSLALRVPGIAAPQGRIDWTADITAGRLPPRGVVTFDLNGVSADSLPPALAGGILSGSGRFDGPLMPPDSLAGEARLQVTGLDSFRGLDRMDLVARLDRSNLDLSVDGPGLHMTAQGAVFDSAGPDVAFRLAVDEVARYLDTDNRVSAQLSAEGRLAGSWEAPRVTADVRTPELNLFGHRERQVTGSVSYADSAVAFRIENPRGTRLSGRAELGGPRTIGADLVVPSIDYAEIRAALPDSIAALIPDGTASARGHIEGTLSRPRGHLEVTGGRVSPFGVAIDTLFARADFEPGIARLSGAIVRPEPGGRVELTGEMPLDMTGDVPAPDRSRNAELRARLAGLRIGTAELDSLRRARLTPLTGAEEIVLAAEGTVTVAFRPGTERPPDWTALLDRAALAATRARLETVGPLEAAGSGNRIDVEPFRIALAADAGDSTDAGDADGGSDPALAGDPGGADRATPGGVIEGHVSTDEDGLLTGDIRTDAMAMSAVHALLPGLPALTGSLSGSIRPRGDVRAPEEMTFAARVDWIHPGVNGVTLDRFSARLEGNAAGVTLDSLFVTAGQDTAMGHGFVRTEPGGGPAELDVTLTARDFRLSSLPFPETQIRKLAGLLNADARVTGTVDAPDLRGFVTITDAAVQTPDMSAPVEHLNARLRMEGQVIHVDTLEIGRGSNVLATGGVTLNGSEPPDLDLKLVVRDFDLKTVPLPPGSVRLLEGKLNGAARITGTARTPALSGKFALADGAVQAGPMLLPVRNLRSQMRLDGTRVVIDSLYTNGSGGNADLSGWLDLADMKSPAFDVTGTLEGLTLNLDPGVQMGLTGPLSLRGSLTSSRFTSELRITEGRYAEKFDLRRFLAQRRTVIVQSAASREMLDGMNIDLHVFTRRPEDFRVDNNLADIPLSLDLRISGTALDWRIAGTAEAEPNTGKVYYLDREFSVTGLSAVFDNPKYPDPTLNVSAETSVTSGETYDITLNVTGRASEARTVLSSDPALSQPDIAALLTLGVPVSGLAGSGSSGSATDVFLNRARELTTATIFSMAGQRAADLTGLSRVQFSADEGGIESTRVTLGKDFGRRLSVDTTTSIADPSVPRLELNWRLNRRFSIRSIGDQASESSVDLRYVLRFR